ncbi:peptidase S8/S53 domain-containing protein [Cokeromyces recurvatus]|uniref:peptidase S8/S53 domain-containing protein n=1 Tax=Cokeromyces recurvatus TaxID=90255 RepID=UPI00221F8797|nr:peptidase S8/S53 domain-containing protein [Cokeromyces recurvatus]KAI7902416.1 peptidase S8/S53 domain-containing protein [Cokeromyces recurvatus]
MKGHYETFQILHGLQNGYFDLSATTSNSFDISSIKNVDIDSKFEAIFGTFQASFVDYLSQLEDVEYIEPNHIYRAPVLPALVDPKPYVPSSMKPINNEQHQKRNLITQFNVPSWGLARVSHRDNDDLASYTYEDSFGHDIHVYIFDSGIEPTHPDFGGRAIMEANFIEYEGDTDLAGHGTHVAGTIGGNTFGIAKNVILHGVKILDATGEGRSSSLLQAISYVIKKAERGRSLINLSLTGPPSQVIDDALSMIVKQHGIPVFVSAGNTGNDACQYSPSANPDVFVVGASDIDDTIPSFSSFGDCVRIYAPGTNITSSWLGGQSRSMQGTSMANPHVTGIAAILMSQYKFSKPSELYEAIKSSATQKILKQSSHEDNSLKLLAYYGH